MPQPRLVSAAILCAALSAAAGDRAAPPPGQQDAPAGQAAQPAPSPSDQAAQAPGAPAEAMTPPPLPIAPGQAGSGPAASAAPVSSPDGHRHASISGHAVTFSVNAQRADARLPVTAAISGDTRALLATLLHRGWALHLHLGGVSAGEPSFRLDGRTADVEFEHSGARIDERYRLWLWRRKERPRDMTLWLAVTAKVSNVQPLQPAGPPHQSLEARDRLLADLSFALAQSRPLTTTGAAGPRLVWSVIVAAPEGAEELVPTPEDVAGSNAPGLSGVAHAASPDAGPVEEPTAQPPLARDLHVANPRTPMRLAVAESVQSAVAGIQRLAPLPPPQPQPWQIINRPEHTGRRIALTFDACSTLDRSFYDERVMKVLRETRTPATLFISGRWAETHQDTIKELAKEPQFEIANHSYIHPHMTEIPFERQQHELLWTQQILLTLTGKLPRFFRPPYGEVNEQLLKVVAETGLRTVEYDFPSGDPDKNITKERMVKWVLQKARPGSIVVMHMNRNGWHTGEALPEIISGLRKAGFELARVGDLVDAEDAARAPGGAAAAR